MSWLVFEHDHKIEIAPADLTVITSYLNHDKINYYVLKIPSMNLSVSLSAMPTICSSFDDAVFKMRELEK